MVQGVLVEENNGEWRARNTSGQNPYKNLKRKLQRDTTIESAPALAICSCSSSASGSPSRYKC
jgi:hypothetical protein